MTFFELFTLLRARRYRLGRHELLVIPARNRAAMAVLAEFWQPVTFET